MGMDRAGAQIDERGATGSVAPQGDKELIEFVRGRSVPCPRCGYELRNLESARCPECGEPLILMVGSPKARFGWLVLAMAPGCFSFVSATLLAVPIVMTTLVAPRGKGPPWPIYVADAFGWLSAASLVLMYRERQRIMAWAATRQAWFAGGVWCAHLLMFAAVIAAMAFLV